jgi:hypothetical protein
MVVYIWWVWCILALSNQQTVREKMDIIIAAILTLSATVGFHLGASRLRKVMAKK